MNWPPPSYKDTHIEDVDGWHVYVVFWREDIRGEPYYLPIRCFSFEHAHYIMTENPKLPY